MVKIRTKYGKRYKGKTIKFGKTRTIQAHKDECDINNIVKRGLQTGALVDPTKKRREAMFGDFVNGQTFEAQQEAIARVKSEFLDLPSHMREHFDNNPAKLMDALDDGERLDELTELGIYDHIEERIDQAKAIGQAVAEALKTEPEGTE